jgi:hypothetical protein
MTDRQTDDEVQRQLTRLAQRLVTDRVRWVVIVTAGDIVKVEKGPPGSGSELPPGLSAYDARILRAATARPQTARRLASLCGSKCNSYFRIQLARLVEAGHLLHGPRGYSRS